MEANFTPLALVVMLVGAYFILFGPRQHVVSAILLVGTFVSMRNRVAIFSLDFMVHRILVVLGWVRLFSRGEFRGVEYNSMDKVFVWLSVWGVVAYTVLWGTFGSLIYRLGIAFDMLGLYLLYRALVRTWDDWVHVIRGLSWVAFILAIFMSIELITHRNLLATIGLFYGEEEVWNRKGSWRCQGSFGHPISAGIFGASLLPLWIAWSRQPEGKVRGYIGIVTSTVITGASASSSTLLAYAAAWFGLCFWPLRLRLRPLRWFVVAGLALLHLVMEAPVWALIARVNVFGGSTGYHRYRLLDHFITRFSEWWLFGARDTENWGLGLWDVCNQYVLEGVRGGFLRLALFIAMLALGFRAVGRAMHSAPQGGPRAFLVWSLGVMLFTHCVSFSGFDYWDQIILLWYLLLAWLANVPRVCAEGLLGTESVTPSEGMADAAGEPSVASASEAH